MATLQVIARYKEKGKLIWLVLSGLGLGYVDIYEPARIDESIPVEEIVGAVQELVDAGYVRYVGLTELFADKLERAAKVCPVHTVEMHCGLILQKKMFATLKKHFQLKCFKVWECRILHSAMASLNEYSNCLYW